MKVNAKQHRFLKEVLANWEREQLISSDQREQLQNSLDVRSFSWKVLAGYLFWAALSSLGLAFLAVLMDEALLNWLKQLFNLSPMIKSGLFFVVAVLTYIAGHYFQAKERFRSITRELIYVPGTLLIVGSLYFLGVALDSDSGHISALVLLGAGVYLVTAAVTVSSLVWSAGLFCLALGSIWEVIYQMGSPEDFLDSWVLMLMVVYGFFGVVVSYGLLMVERLKPFFAISRLSSLILSFFGLWALSCVTFDGDDACLFWFLNHHGFWLSVFSLVGLATAALGLWLQDSVFRGVGTSFVFINIYTRFFEYAWDEMHKAVFFGLMGISFWVLGRVTESIWIKSQSGRQ